MLNLSLCVYCKHYQGSTCAAFPRGIPEAIRRGDIQHVVPMYESTGPDVVPMYESTGPVFEPSDAEAAEHTKPWVEAEREYIERVVQNHTRRTGRKPRYCLNRD